MVEKKARGDFLAHVPSGAGDWGASGPQLRKLLGFLSIWVDYTTIMLSHHSEGSCPAPARRRFGLWSLLIPATKEKRQSAGVWKIACRCRCFFLDVMIDCQLQQLTGRKDGKNAHNTGFWFDLILTGLQAQQGSRILGLLIACTRRMQTSTWTACRVWGHVNILWYHLELPVCLCLPQSPSERHWMMTPRVNDRPYGLAGWMCATKAWCVLHRWLINIEFLAVMRQSNKLKFVFLTHQV